MTKLTAANQKSLTLGCPNLVTFSFYPQETLSPNFSKIDQSGGLLMLFSHGDEPKIFKKEKIFLCLKIAEIHMGVNFGSRRKILDIKTHILKV